MLLKDFIKDSRASLEGLYPSGEALAMVLRLCEDRLGVTGYTHIVEPQTEIPEEKLSELEEAIDRFSKGEPLQYVLGSAEFLGLKFRVNPSVLIPRPETEQLANAAISRLKRLGPDNPRVLDLCTGSGCIAWSIALFVPGAEVVAVDISEDALAVAGSQFAEGLPSGVVPPRLVRRDVLSDSLEDLGSFDMILSNPPYVKESEKALMRPNVLEWEPSLALFVPDDDALKFYSAIARHASSLLAEGGSGIVEINEALGPGTAGLFSAAGLENVEVIKDFRERDRFVAFLK